MLPGTFALHASLNREQLYFCMDRHIDVWMNGLINGWMDILTHTYMNGGQRRLEASN